MKTRKGEAVSTQMLEQIRRLEALPEEAIDTSDMPEVTDWSDAVRGKYYRPVKKPYSLRLDVDVVDWFKSEGDGYQTRINAVLREYASSRGKRVV